VREANAQGKFNIDEVTELHVQDTIKEMLSESRLISEKIAAGKLALVGANYKLALGEIHPIVSFGNIV
jgi:carbonic anhydrase